jgi:hypothetical protein
MWLVALALAAPDPVAPAPSAACDVPTPPLSRQSTADAPACAAACAADPACGAWAYVSGWGQCRLHAPTTRKVAVAMIAAVEEIGADGVRAMSAPRRDHDNAGKDLEAAPRDLGSPEDCAAACLGTAACHGYVYVEGYRACWLKREVGALSPKTFTCGVVAPR